MLNTIPGKWKWPSYTNIDRYIHIHAEIWWLHSPQPHMGDFWANQFESFRHVSSTNMMIAEKRKKLYFPSPSSSWWWSVESEYNMQWANRLAFLQFDFALFTRSRQEETLHHDTLRKKNRIVTEGETGISFEGRWKFSPFSPFILCGIKSGFYTVKEEKKRKKTGTQYSFLLI